MKHLAFPFLLWLLLAFFALSVASSGCKKDDQPDTAFDRSKVIGTWIEKEYWTDDDLDGIFTLHS
ncbi:MAG TPA: hypothetical protein PK858_09665, partial [Saprospiraceae bacterium]|nr:hypothetical protein [Saprospiraceae bacterium]